MNHKLCFLNSCDAKYAEFIISFVYFSSLFNKGAAYEFLLTEKISDDLNERIKKLAELLNVDISLRHMKGNPAYIRFIEEPSKHYDYTYIGDIDILILEDILPFHLEQIKKHNAVYDNVRRIGVDRMSGLQFCLDKYFDLTRNARSRSKTIQCYSNDEVMLYHLIQESGLSIRCPASVSSFLATRPIHGIHVSLNRAPFRSDTMNFGCERKFAVAFLEIIDRDEFKDAVKPLFSTWMSDIFNKVLPLIEKEAMKKEI